MKIKQLIGMERDQENIKLKISFEKLQFLASEMQKGNDRKNDARFWKEELELVKSLDSGKSFSVTKAREAYETLYALFIKRHGLTGEQIQVIEEYYSFPALESPLL